jgi:two-component system, NtrC family, sensor histidine kinase KinB
MIKLGLRTRFLLMGAVLVLTTAASALWSAFAFARLSRVVGETLSDSEQTTGATAAVTNALEREDDALLLSLSGDARAERDLEAGRSAVDAAFARLDTLLTTPVEHTMATALRRDIDAYQVDGDSLVAVARQPEALDRYHRRVNPLLRRAVAAAEHIRDQHFRSTRDAAIWARDEARRATGIVTGIAFAALVLSVIVSFHLARVVIWPLRELTRSVDAIRHGDFEHRMRPRSGDELGRLVDGYNRMAEHLAEFRRSNLGEVLRAKETLEATLAALPDAVIVIDPEGRVSAANKVASEILEAAGTMAPSLVDDLPLPPGAVDAVRAALAGDRLRETGIDLGKAIPVALGGDARRLLPRVVPVMGFSAGRHGAVLVLYDVTELVRLDEMRVELVAVASHELRTPLTTLRMTLLMLGEGARGLTPRQQDLLATALVGVDQLATTVDEFLDLTRIEAGQLRLTWDRVDVAMILGHALGALRPQCAEAGVELAAIFGEATPTTLWGDAARLGVVVSNILTNAVKYTPTGGKITVRVVSVQNAGPAGRATLQITVTDTGPGVPAEYRERIFEKFFRVEHHHPAPGEGVRGAGIGLYLSRQIVEAHGGTIRCEPGEDGRGTTIAMALPIERPEGAPQMT